MSKMPNYVGFICGAILAIVVSANSHSGAEAAVNGGKGAALGYLGGYLLGWVILKVFVRGEGSAEDSRVEQIESALDKALDAFDGALTAAKARQSAMAQEAGQPETAQSEASLPGDTMAFVEEGQQLIAITENAIVDGKRSSGPEAKTAAIQRGVVALRLHQIVCKSEGVDRALKSAYCRSNPSSAVEEMKALSQSANSLFEGMRRDLDSASAADKPDLKLCDRVGDLMDDADRKLAEASAIGRTLGVLASGATSAT